MATGTHGGMLGLFREPEEVARALEGLRAAGFTGRELEVLSGTPYPEGTFGEEPVSHRLPLFPLVGAVCGFAVGLLVTIGTQLSYPMVTGGKPILSIPPMIIVLFEGTMLGAIIFTFLGVLFESRLPDFSGPYDPRISQGYLGVAVRTKDQLATVDRLLRDAGALDVVGPPREPLRPTGVAEPARAGDDG